MPSEFWQQYWAEAQSSGSFHEMLKFIWSYLTFSDLQTAFFLMLWTLTLRVLLITVYFSITYMAVAFVKKRMQTRLSVTANYNSWVLLIGSVVLANLRFNSKLFVWLTELHRGDSLLKAYIFTLLTLVFAAWFIGALIKLAALTRMNRRIKRTIRRMERYVDNAGITEWAVWALGLRRTPDIRIAGFIETPVSYGFFRKTVLLPANYKDKYTDTGLSLLLLHEMTHIKHGDTIKLLLIQLMKCVLWMSPVMGRFIKNFKRDSEMLCDNRVISLRSDERDTYGELILKECAYKTARFGFGFSDSYNAVANRLDALYRYKAPKHLKWLIAIPITALLLCAVSFALRSDWIAVNDRYNADFEFYAYDNSTGEYVLLTPNGQEQLYELEDLNGSLNIHCNEEMLRELAKPYASDGQIQLMVVSLSYTVASDENDMTTGLGSCWFISEEKQELAIIVDSSYIQLRQRTFAEYLFLLIASKI